MPHALEQRKRADHVVAVIFGGLPHRFTHERGGGEMDNCAHRVRTTGGTHGGDIADIALEKGPPSYEVTTSDRQVVECNGQVSCARESLAGVGADIASAARDQDGGPY